MGKPNQFDLNGAILSWREQLGRSRQLRDENLAELESHLRDAVTHLQGTELSEEEAFLIATHRIGSVEELAMEFEKINRNPMNKIIHGLVFVFLSISCWFIWGLLTATERLMPRLLGGRPLPAFTALCLGLKPIFYALPILALAWCVVIWLRKADARNSWIGFFAVGASVIMLTVFPTVIAMYLPLVAVLEMAARK